MSIKIKARLPRGARDGISDMDERLQAEARLPRSERGTVLCVMELGVHALREIVDTDDGDIEVELTVLHLEPIEGPDRDFVQAVARVARARRTGAVELPGFGVNLDEAGDPVIDYAAEGIAAAERLLAEAQRYADEQAAAEAAEAERKAARDAGQVTVSGDGVVLTPAEVADLTGTPLERVEAASDAEDQTEWDLLRAEAAAVQAERAEASAVDAEGVEVVDLPDVALICGEQHIDGEGVWTCNLPQGHDGEHLAEAPAPLTPEDEAWEASARSTDEPGPDDLDTREGGRPGGQD